MADLLIREIRLSLRALAARPLYSGVTIATLALVIGGGVAVLAVANATLVRPLPWPGGDRLLNIVDLPPASTTFTDSTPLQPRIFARLRERARAAEAVEGVWRRDRALDGDGDDPESVGGGDVTAGVFALFGGTAALGRTFTEGEARANARVVVLSDQLWRRRYGGDRAIVGRTIAIDRESYEIIGVMPRGFEIASTPLQLWTPLELSERTFAINASLLTTYARRAPGQTAAAVQAEIDALMPGIVAEAPDMLRSWHPRVQSLRNALFGPTRGAVLALVAAVLVLAVLAGANLASLTLAQVLSRRYEYALRAALGGTRAAAVRGQLVETGLLTAAGLAGGLVFGNWILHVVVRLDPTTSHALEGAAVDWRVQLGAAALAFLVGLVSGVLPVLRELRRDPARAVIEGGARTAGTPRDQRARNTLIAVQAASVVVLLAGSAVLGSGLLRAGRAPLGFDPANVLTAQMRISASSYPDERRREQLITRVLEEVRAVPGVVAAGTTLNPFTPGDSYTTLVQIVGHPSPDGQPYSVDFRRVSRGYFAAMRIRLLEGRDFAPTDTFDTPGAAIVSRQFAERYWPGEDAIGRGITRGTNPKVYTVVGIVDDVNDIGLGSTSGPTIYLTYTQNNVAVTPVSLVVRTAADPVSFARALRAAVREADPRQPIDKVIAMEQFLADSLGPQRFRAVLALALSALAVIIAAVGIFGVTARAVADRRRELGVRLALGATPSGLVRLVTWQALRSVLGGLAAGAALTVPASAALVHALPNVQAGDAWSVVPATAALLTVALLATAVPAARAATTDPIIAIRNT